MEDMQALLKPFSCTMAVIEQLTFPVSGPDGTGQLLILPSDNILEMMEEALEEEASLTLFVEMKLEQVHSLTKLDALRHIVSAYLAYVDLPPEVKRMDDKSFEEVYAAYARVWEGNELLDENQTSASYAYPEINADWIEARMEDGALLLPMKADERYHAPLIIPMGGYNECPQPLYQAALFKHWQDEFEMMPLAVTQNTWVVRAGRLPATDNEALQLAKEHFMFCQYVLDSFDSVGQYASYLKCNEIWYFWWD